MALSHGFVGWSAVMIVIFYLFTYLFTIPLPKYRLLLSDLLKIFAIGPSLFDTLIGFLKESFVE